MQRDENWPACSASYMVAEQAGATFDRTAGSFDNPDHVSIVIHNYRGRLGLVEGESKYDDLEEQLAKGPVITVPSITLEGDANGAPHPDASSYDQKFLGKYAHRIINGLILKYAKVALYVPDPGWFRKNFRMDHPSLDDRARFLVTYHPWIQNPSGNEGHETSGL